MQQVKHGDKSEIYGSALILCGGKVSGDKGAAEDPAPKPTDLVPMNWHGMSPKSMEEITHSYNIKGWIDLTANDGQLAYMCVRQRKPYLGFVFTEKHKDALMEFVSDKVFTAFQKVGDALHDPNIKDAIKKGGKGDGAEDALEEDDGDDDTAGDDDASQKAPTTKTPRRPTTKKKPETSGLKNKKKKKPAAGGSGGVTKADLLQKLKEMNDAADTDEEDDEDDNADDEEEFDDN